MIVYGDPQFSQSLSIQVARLRQALLRLSQNEPSLDDVRELLVQAGQLEQAVHDVLPAQLPPEEAQQWIERCQSFTNGMAKAFYGKWLKTQRGVAFDSILPLLHLYLKDIETWPLPDVEVSIKLPEGFAFYTLFPEQYAASISPWIDERYHELWGPFIVIGVRSIGTSLSALVKTLLKSNGWKVHRLTVRPNGHPFERETKLSKDELRDAQWAWIVDEGPGLSGSSMASVAQAAHELGIARERIVFFPGHDGEPGIEASSRTRAWWNTTERFTTSLNELRWNNQTLPEFLASRTRELLNTSEGIARIDDFSGGLWRHFEYSNESLWPPVATQFERTKYRVTLNDGRAVLWKFAGFVSLKNGTATSETLLQINERAANGFMVAPLGSCCGFVATPWIEGRPLTREDATPQLLRHIGRYLVSCSGAPMTCEEAQISRNRLVEMLICNTREAFGEEAAKCAQLLSEQAKTDELAPSYGDGHLAPHEWIRTPDNRVLKIDCCGHNWDHTMVGRQSWLWDLAGALVEWDLNKESATPLLEEIVSESSLAFAPDELRFYCSAYAAFRLGLFTIEKNSAADFYRAILQRELNEETDL